MVQKRPLKRHEVRWHYPGDKAEQVTRYVVPGHHEDRGRAKGRNETVASNVEAYDQACEDGTAVIVSHHTEVDDGEA